jgi:hypothetical protein
MPIVSTFKICTHVPEGVTVDWRNCFACIDEVTTQLMIARTYLKELSEGVFNEHGDMSIPVTEPIRGQHFQRIAQTAYSIVA